jgi:multiple sugar transport system ATP-binding protein
MVVNIQSRSHEHAVVCREVTKEFGSGDTRTIALRGVDLQVAYGEATLLVGPSGCGKTTLISIIAGLLNPTDGEVSVLGEDLVHLRGADVVNFRKQNIGFVFQQYNLLPALTAAENAAVPLVIGGEYRTKALHIAKELLADVGLERRVNAYPSQLSGGQQQRVALARALVKEPKVFLFDEPLSNLDATLRTRTRIEIKKLHQQVKATSIFVTHDQEEAMMLSDLIAVMQRGKVVQLGSPDEIYKRPANRYVATFVGKPQMNLFEVTGEQRDGMLQVIAPGLSLGWNANEIALAQPLGGAQVAFGIRSEDVKVISSTDARLDSVTGNVTLIEPLGPDSYIEVAFGPNSMTVRVEPDRTPRLGETITIQVPASKLHFFEVESGRRIN